jgi:hypothetical protein
MQRSEPGATLPPDPADGSLYIAPDLVLPREALESFAEQSTGAPIRAPTPDVVQPDYRVTRFSHELARVSARTPTVGTSELGAQRYAALAELGLDDADNLERRLARLSREDHADLVHAVFDTARAFVDRLIEQAGWSEPPTALWAETQEVPRLVGRTLLWADQYLAPDTLAEALLRNPELREAPRLEGALRDAIALRPLVEAGVVVPVPLEVATVLTGEAASEATEGDLADPKLVEWVLSQLEVEGPTDREVALVRARDHLGPEGIFFYGHINSASTEEGLFISTYLGEYKPDYDYDPWLGEVRKQTAGSLVQDVNRNLALAEAFGAQFLSQSLFEGRLMQRKGRPAPTAASLLAVDVPVLPDAAPATLARLAGSDEAVEGLRSAVRRSFQRVKAEGGDARPAASALVEELEEASYKLEDRIRRERTWKVVIPGVLGVGGVVVGGVAGGPLGAAAGALSALAGAAPHIADRANYREDPGYALLLARGGEGRKGKGEGERALRSGDRLQKIEPDFRSGRVF